MNIPDLETMTPFKAPRGFVNVLLTALSDIYTGSCNVMPKPKVLKPLHFLTAFHAGVNWCRWPVRPVLRSTRGDRRSLQRLITTAIYNITKTGAEDKLQEQSWIAKFDHRLDRNGTDTVLSFLCSRAVQHFVFVKRCLQQSTSSSMVINSWITVNSWIILTRNSRWKPGTNWEILQWECRL